MGELVQPLINLMREELLESGFVQCDESRYQVLKEPGKTAESLSYIWVQRAIPHGHPLILYEYDRSRSAEVPKRLFEGYEGVLQTDGYAGYDRFDDKQSKVTHVGCFAHARRKFFDATLSSPRESHQIVKDVLPEERYRVRQDRSLRVLADLREWLDASLGAVVPQSLTGKALAYLNGQWPKLVRVFDHGEVPLDTNLVENAIRPFAIGRKNWMFADTVHGAEASANLYSLVETAKANDLEPWAYLERVFQQIPSAETIEDLDALLPHRIRMCNDGVG